MLRGFDASEGILTVFVVHCRYEAVRAHTIDVRRGGIPFEFGLVSQRKRSSAPGNEVDSSACRHTLLLI